MGYFKAISWNLGLNWRSIETPLKANVLTQWSTLKSVHQDTCLVVIVHSCRVKIHCTSSGQPTSYRTLPLTVASKGKWCLYLRCFVNCERLIMRYDEGNNKMMNRNGCNVFIRNILAFIQVQVDVMAEDSMIRLSVTAFPLEDVWLRWTCLSVGETSGRSHKGWAEERVQRYLQDIISFIKCT